MLVIDFGQTVSRDHFSDDSGQIPTAEPYLLSGNTLERQRAGALCTITCDCSHELKIRPKKACFPVKLAYT
jgi:hypothetical protein